MTEITVDCPQCSWSKEVTNVSEEIARKVDGEIHWQEQHGGLVPDEADFGHNQCPECEDMSGLDGTVSCSECGHVPEVFRA